MSTGEQLPTWRGVSVLIFRVKQSRTAWLLDIDNVGARPLLNVDLKNLQSSK